MNKADVLLHPVRMRIIQKLLLGKPLTILQLVDILGDVPQATLYRHMKLMLEAEVIEVVETNKVQGREERLFSIAKENLKIPDEEIEAVSQEDHVRYFSFYQANLMQQMTSYLMQTPTERYKEDGLGYWQTPLHLTDEQFQKFVEKINTILIEYSQLEPGADSTTRTFASILIPQKMPENKEGGRS